MASPVSLSSELESRIAARTARIGIIGMGYVGLPLVLLFSEQRFHITGFDVDTTKVEALNSGNSYIVRIPAPEIVKAQSSGFSATSAYAEIAQMDIIIICVPTPLDEYHQPDLSYIEKTAQAIAPHLRQGQLVILESTTYPGTTEEILIPILESGNPSGLRAIRKPGEPGFHVAFSPEREDPGNDTTARRDIPKVIGGARTHRHRDSRSPLRQHLQSHRAGLVARYGGDDQAPRKHLSLRQHCPRQRAQTALRAHGHRYL